MGEELPAIIPDDLTDEDKARVQKLVDSIDLSDSNAILQYGAATQGRISGFADTILSKISAGDTAYVGEILSDLMKSVQALNVDGLSEKNRGLLSRIPLLGGLMDRYKRFSEKYQDLSTRIVGLIDKLNGAKGALLGDVEMLEDFYAQNLQYYKELQLHILAGEQKAAEIDDVLMPRAKSEAASSDDPMASQRYRDMQETAGRLEKKLHDLRLSRTVALQAAPQIRLVQNNNRLLAEKIQSSVLNTIPLWKNQIVIALSLLRQRQAMDLQGKVSDTTNELLRKNAEMLREGTVDISREAERGIVDIDTLKKVNAELINTIDETLKISREGQARREDAQREISGIEAELKEKLREVREMREGS